MANPNKARGDAFERAVRDYLLERGVTCERIPAGATQDHGDLWLPGGPVIQCKNHARIDLAGWIDETRHQMENAGRSMAWVAVKRRGKGVERSYLITELGLGWHLLGDT